MILKQRETDLEAALDRSLASGQGAETTRLKGLMARVKAKIQEILDEREFNKILAEEREFEFRAEFWRNNYHKKPFKP